MIDNILDYARIALYTLLAILGFLLYQAWIADHPPAGAAATSAATTSVVSSSTTAAATDHYVPDATTTATAATTTTAVAASSSPPSSMVATPANTPLPTLAKGQLVKVMTDLLQVTIDTRGGDIVEAQLLKYPESLGSVSPFLLFNDNPSTRYIAESGLLSKRGPDMSSAQALYKTAKTDYVLDPNQNSLVVKFNWEENGVKVTKLFTFTRDSYEIKIGYEINNQSLQPWEGNLYTQFIRTDTPPPSHGGLVNLATYFGAAISSPQKPYEKISFGDMRSNNLERVIPDGWVAMVQHYFVGAWVPPKTAVSTYYSKNLGNNLYAIGMIGAAVTAAPGATIAAESKLYAGPAIAERLEKTAPSLQLTIDYGWFWFIAIAIFWMMQKIYDVVGNWGWAIVLVTVIIKLLFYHLSNKSYRSMSMMKKLQPKIEALKLRHGDDKQALTKATLDLYRQEKVNPMSGCLPILVQIPVFIALYWVLVESVQLRQAPFILWIHDLSQQDPYYILPILMGISMYLQQRLNPPPPDPLQAKVMMLLPIVFTVMFANFPAGLMLYWFVNNTLSFLQQWYIMHKMGKETTSTIVRNTT